MYLVPDFLSKLLKNKLIRFFIVSGINTVFGYGLFALLIFIGVTYPLALLISTIAGILFNFKTIGVVIFKNHNNLLIFKFFGVYGITYLCNLGGLALFKSFGINIYLSGAILLIPIGLLAFMLNKTFVFKDDYLCTKG
jgi:putative flippase GtrA